MATAMSETYLEECQAWQKVISVQPNLDAKSKTGKQALRALKNRTSHGSRHVLVGADIALQIPDGTNPLEEQIWPYLQFGELKTKGWLGRLYCVGMKDDVLLTWPIYHASILGPTEEDYLIPGEGLSDDVPDFRLPIEEPLSRSLHFPVGLINYAVVYDTPGSFRAH